MADPITVRLSEELAVQLRKLATFDRVTLADEIREAIKLLVDARKSDPNYRSRVEAALEEAKEALQALDSPHDIVAALGDPLDERRSEAEVQLDREPAAVAGAASL